MNQNVKILIKISWKYNHVCLRIDGKSSLVQAMADDTKQAITWILNQRGHISSLTLETQEALPADGSVWINLIHYLLYLVLLL